MPKFPKIAEPLYKPALIKLGETEYKLVFDFNAIAQAEEHAKVNLLQAFHSLSDLSAAQFRGLLYAALRHFHPELSLADTGKLIKIETMFPLQSAIAEAYRNSMPEASPKPDEPVETAA